jgi:hypothetical protein
MGYKDVGYIARLVSDKKAPLWNANSLSDEWLLTSLADLLAPSSEELLQRTVHRWARSFMLLACQDPVAQILDNKTTLRYFTASAPVCPGCLRDDPVSHERLVWLFKPAPICPDHQCLLMDRCPDCQRQLRPNRRLVQQCNCGSDIRQWRVAHVSDEAVNLARDILPWIDGEELPIPGLRAAACFWWMDRVRACLDKRRECLDQWQDEPPLPTVAIGEQRTWFAATSTLQNWPDRFLSLLEVLQRNTDAPAASTISQKFGYLPREAAKLEAFGYSVPADVLRDYLLAHYTRGHLSRKVCLFKSAAARNALSTRDWLTQTQAATSLGLRHGAIRGLIERRLLDGEVNNAGTRTVGLVRRESVARLKQDLRVSLSRTQAASRLGIGPHQLVDLIRLDLLGSVRTQRGWRVLKRSLQSIEDRYAALPVATRITSNWSSARQATRIHGPTGLTFAKLWQRVVSGEIRGRRLRGEPSLKGLIVSNRDLRRVLPDIQAEHYREHGYPLNHVAKILLPGRPTKERVLKKWIRMRILRVCRSGRSLLCSQHEIDRFCATYCHAVEVCELLRISRASLARWETEGRIQPIYGKRVTPGAGFSLYCREDVSRIEQQREAGEFRRAA